MNYTRTTTLVAAALLSTLTSRDGAALCRIPEPEEPRLLQSESVALAPGDAFAMYLSSGAQTLSFSLRPTAGSSRAPVSVSVAQVVPFVFRAVVPSGTAPGVYEVVSAASRGAPTQVAGRITVGQPSSTRPPSVVRGQPRLQTSTHRRGTSSSLTSELSDRNLTDAVVVFRWRARGRQFGNATWLTGSRTVFVAGAGRCGPSPFDSAGAPPAGTTIEVAQLGRDGTPGPFTRYVVR